MRQFLLLAFRNVFRNRRRTLMTLMVTAGGVSGLLLFGGFFAYMFRGLREVPSAMASATCRSSTRHSSIAKRRRFSSTGSRTSAAWRNRPENWRM